MLWVEMPPGTVSLDVYDMAVKCGLSVAPGCAFSVSNKFSNCVRLNAACVTPRIEPMVRKLGAMIGRG